MSRLDELDVKYDPKRHFVVVIIVVVVLLLIFVLSPFIYDLVIGGSLDSREPSERLHDAIFLVTRFCYSAK
ncbi:MAG: hypothetical protein GF383_13775 [Candidatus Lokiarchaeota archaeon]|nr:hypothetical protein [Candidatus Lokiarchaeota archaeon]MBD3342340.1 hypothetical protein [Candidatus Lokiarchaeota archaeon]